MTNINTAKKNPEDHNLRHVNAGEITKSDIKEAKTSDLVALYNEITGSKISKFSDRETAEKRTWNVVEQLATDQQNKPKASKPTVVTPKKREAYENKLIKVIKGENHKRAGSRAFDKYALLLKMDGHPMKDFKAMEGKHSKLDLEKGWPATELRWAVAHGLVKLVNA